MDKTAGDGVRKNTFPVSVSHKKSADFFHSHWDDSFLLITYVRIFCQLAAREVTRGSGGGGGGA